MKEVERRRKYSKETLAKVKNALSLSSELLGVNGCIYVTGSFGRLEASNGSDLDLFIACDGNRDRQFLTGLQEIKLKADLINAVEALQLPDFDGDGGYLEVFPEDVLEQSIGAREDDYANSFTARLLLLLEGQPLLGDQFFEKLRARIINSYWRDYQGHEEGFIPAFFANDVLRLWRTFCVNYEARTSGETPERLSKRRSKNYRLRHTRILTCYSALAMFLHAERKAITTDPEYAAKICSFTPLARIEHLQFEGLKKANRVLQLYERSLERSAETDFKKKFDDEEYNDERRMESREFSEAFFDLLMEAGEHTTLIKRMLV